MISATDALIRLREGNARFVSGVRSIESIASQMHRSELTGSQSPHTIVLGCSDSRVPAELVFDQGLGDLFVIRVAGNIVAPSQIGSVEFAAEHIGTRLVVVLGHSMCAAVSAALAQLDQPTDDHSPHLKSIVDRIRPNIATVHEMESSGDRDALLKSAVRANVRACVAHLRSGSQLLEQLIDTGRLVIVGAEYDLETGIVNFFEGIPQEV